MNHRFEKLRLAGCICEEPLEGTHGVTGLPRCRLCNTQVIDKQIKPSEAVREFHEKFDIPKAHPSDVQSVQFRMRLISEEYREVIEAARKLPKDREHLLKELSDLAYVIYGTAEAFGWDLDEAVRRVHASNMTKLGEDGQPLYREDGKVMKGPNYKEPYLGDLV